jgi:hypothetical protein
MPIPLRQSIRMGAYLLEQRLRGRDNCMAHCGYEPTAVLATMRSLKQSVRAFAGR